MPAARQRVVSLGLRQTVSRKLAHHREPETLNEQLGLSAPVSIARQDPERAPLLAGQLRHCTPVARFTTRACGVHSPSKLAID
jgi:hypothetical protein